MVTAPLLTLLVLPALYLVVHRVLEARAFKRTREVVVESVLAKE
jgi:hypothetical protein